MAATLERPDRVGRRATGLFAILLAAAGTAGCVQVVMYRPDPGVVGKEGPEAAMAELSSLVQRAREPHVTWAQVEDRFLEYAWVAPRSADLYYMAGVPHDARIYYDEVTSFRLTSNHHVQLWGPADIPIARFVFQDQGSAQRFLDLLVGLRDRAAPPAGQPAAGAAGSPPPAPPPGK